MNLVFTKGSSRLLIQTNSANVEDMFEVHANLNAHLILITAEPNTLSHVIRYSASRHVGIKTAEITVRVNSRSSNYRKLSPKTVSAAQTHLCFCLHQSGFHLNLQMNFLSQ